MVKRGILLFFILMTCHCSFSQSLMEKTSAFRENYEKELYKVFPHSKVDYFEPNERFNLQANYKIVKKGKMISIPTSGVKIKDYKEYAKVKFKIDKKQFELTVYQPLPINPNYEDHLFLPLKDLTAPDETYGGGRYMDLKLSDFKDKKVNIDFNQLYNPYCVFSSGWNCPIPPKNNHLNLRIEAGEKLPLVTEYDFD